MSLSHCNTNIQVSIRYASTSNRIYVESEKPGGCITLDEIYNSFEKKSPLSKLQSGIWLLTSDLYVTGGSTLNILGTLYFDETRVISWDDAIDGPDEDYENGRSYVNCLSEMTTGETCKGFAKNDMGECRMDIFNTEMSYLGYHASESWGVTYKTRGFCVDKSNPEIFDSVKVYGDIKNSKIHHNYYGHYSFGQFGGNWTGNEVHSNVVYGFDPHDYSRNLTINDNIVYNNGLHGIIASKWCSHVTIINNTVSTSDVGIFLHSLGDYAIVKNNTVTECRVGIGFFESSHGLIDGNKIIDNEIGIRFSAGSMDNLATNNIIRESLDWDIFSFEGSEPVVELENGRPSDNIISDNSFSTFKLKNSDRFVFYNNSVKNGNFVLENSTRTLLNGNGEEIEIQILDNSSCINPESDLPSVYCTVEIEVPTENDTEFTFNETESPSIFEDTESPSIFEDTESMIDESNSSIKLDYSTVSFSFLVLITIFFI